MQRLLSYLLDHRITGGIIYLSRLESKDKVTQARVIQSEWNPGKTIERYPPISSMFAKLRTIVQLHYCKKIVGSQVKMGVDLNSR